MCVWLCGGAEVSSALVEACLMLLKQEDDTRRRLARRPSAGPASSLAAPATEGAEAGAAWLGDMLIEMLLPLLVRGTKLDRVALSACQVRECGVRGGCEQPANQPTL